MEKETNMSYSKVNYSCSYYDYSNFTVMNDEEIFNREIVWKRDYEEVKKEADKRRAAEPRYKCGDAIEFQAYGKTQKCLIATVEGKLYLIYLEGGIWWSRGIDHLGMDVNNFGNGVLKRIIGNGDINTVKIVN
jgi:hypothetical protein